MQSISRTLVWFSDQENVWATLKVQLPFNILSNKRGFFICVYLLTGNNSLSHLRVLAHKKFAWILEVVLMPRLFYLLRKSFASLIFDAIYGLPPRSGWFKIITWISFCSLLDKFYKSITRLWASLIFLASEFGEMPSINAASLLVILPSKPPLWYFEFSQAFISNLGSWKSIALVADSSFVTNCGAVLQENILFKNFKNWIQHLAMYRPP